jgi:hypothetical protein
MTPQSKDEPSKPWPPRWTMIYFLVLGFLLVGGSLITLHGYRQWWVDIFFIVAAAGILGGSIKHRMGGQRSH